MKSKVKKKVNTKVLTQEKRRRRRMLTFVRMIRYGVHNFSRNKLLTIAATAVMTITLLIIFSTVVSRGVLLSTMESIQDKIDMTVYLESDATEEAVRNVADKVDNLESVKMVNIITPKEAREQFIKDNNSDPKALKSLNNSDPSFPWRLRIKLVDINQTEELQKFVNEDAELKDIIDESEPPSFAGPQRTAIERIGGWVSFADRVGIIAGSVFVVISSLIIFNTIRMAIFNRREEIQMMKLIGAERSFIRGPFLVEAVVYGFIAAIIATGLGYFGVYGLKDVLAENGIAIANMTNMLIVYSPFVLIGMIAIGALIGIVSAMFATRRYLKL